MKSPPFLYTGLLPPLQCCQTWAGWMDHCGCSLESGRIRPPLFVNTETKKCSCLSLNGKTTYAQGPYQLLNPQQSVCFFLFPSPGTGFLKGPWDLIAVFFFYFYWYRLDSRGDRKGTPLSPLCGCASHNCLSVCLPVFNPYSFCFRKAHYWG